MDSTGTTPWYTLHSETILADLSTRISGLTVNEVSLRLQSYGYNEFQQDEPDPLYVKVFESLKENHLILLLLGSAFLSAVLGHYEDAISITLAIVIVFTVGFIQEYRSEKSLETLKKLAPPLCNVIREGQAYNVLARELVIGDIVKIDVGDRVPADLRIVESSELEVDQSSLTGETEPVRKRHDITLPLDTAISDRSNLAFMGTLVANGYGKGVVVATAQATQFGQVVELMRDDAMDTLGRQLSYASFVVIGFIFLIGVIQGRSLLAMFNIGVSLAVAAIPEGLPVVVMVTLALGVLRMANRNVIVKRMPAVETLGLVNVLCVDKTGTITENKMTVVKTFSVANMKVYDCSNNNSSSELSSLSEDPHLQPLLKIANLCNNAYINSFGNVVGQSTDVGLLNFVLKCSHPDLRQSLTKLEETPFNSDRKWMSVRYDTTSYYKGALETLLPKCTTFQAATRHQTLDSTTKEEILKQAQEFASKGLRVIALATSSTKDTDQLTFVGLVAMHDPPRKIIPETVEKLTRAGVKVVMITGDAENTALSIGHAINMPIDHSTNASMTGSQLDFISDADLPHHIQRTSIFARATPHHKIRIVQAFQKLNLIVAMTGDGVNDAPALKGADIGIAMGTAGTDVAREAADMVLVKDDLNALLDAIEEGKSIFNNIRCFVTFQLSTSVAALTLIALATGLGYPNPLNPMQILWINILMDGPPAQSLGVEPVDHDVIRQPPRSRNQPILTRPTLLRILINATFIVLGTLVVYISEFTEDLKVTQRDTTMTFTCFVLFDMFNALSCRSLTKPYLLPHPNPDTGKLQWNLPFLNTQDKPINKMFIGSVIASLLGQCAVVYLPFFQAIFQTEALSLKDWVGLVTLASTIFWVNELMKFFGYKNARLGQKDVEDLADGDVLLADGSANKYRKLPGEVPN